MARSIQTIQNTILAAIAADPSLSALDSISQTAIYNLFAYIIATIQATEENLNDNFVLQTEAVALTLPPATTGYLNQTALNFQYNSSNPQILQYYTASMMYEYPIVNTAYNIITNSSINVSYDNIVLIKVVQAGPAPLSTDQLNAFSYYMQLKSPKGIQYSYISAAADYIYLAITCYYKGAYSSVIQNNLYTAYINYLNTIPFNSAITINGVITALYNVTGVNEVIINQMAGRSSTTTFGDGIIMVLNNTWITPSYNTIAGYAIDDLSPNDFNTNLQLIQQ